MPPRRNARRRGASASRSATDSGRCNEEGDDKESMCKSSARGRGKRKAPHLLSPSRALSHPVAEIADDSLEVTDDRKSLTEPMSRRILRSDSCTRVVVNESGDGPPSKKRRSEPVKLRQNTSPKEHGKLPGSVVQVLSYFPHPAVETEEDVCILSSNSAAFGISLSAKKSNEIIGEETVPNKDFALASEEASSDIQVKQVDDRKVLMKSTTPMQSGKTRPSMRNESSPVLQAKHWSELSSSSSTSTVSGLFVSDSLDTTFRIHQDSARSKPLDTRTTFERMTSRNLTDCLRIESEEDFKPDYDEDDKHDAAGNASARGTHSTKSCSSHSGVTTSITSLLSTPVQASTASSLPLPLEKSTLLFQPSPSVPKSKCPAKSGKAGDGDAIEGTRKMLSRNETKDSLDFAEIYLPDLTDCLLSDTEEQSSVAIMNDLSRLDDNQFQSLIDQDLLQSPVSISNPVPRQVVKVSGGSKPLNLASKFQSVRNKQAVELSKSLIRHSSVEQKNAGHVTPDTIANPQVSCSSSVSSRLVTETVIKGTKSLDVDQPSNSTFSFCNFSPKDGVNSSAKTACLSLSSNASSSSRLTQSIAVQTDEALKVCLSTEIELDNHVHALCLLTGNSEQQPESNKIQSASEDNSGAKGACQVVKTPTSSCPPFPTTKSRISPSISESKSTINLHSESPHVSKIQIASEFNSVTKGVCQVAKTPTSSCPQFPTTKSRISPSITEQQPESKSTINLHSESPHVNKIQSASEDNSGAKGVCQVVKTPTSSCPPFPTTKSRITPRIPATTGSISILKKVVAEPVLDSTQSLSVDDNSNPKKIRLKRPWKMANKRNDVVSDATSTSSAKVPSPVEKSLMPQAAISPGITVSSGRCEAVSSSDAIGMKQPSEVEMDVSRVSLSSFVMPVSVAVLRQTSNESSASEELLEGDGSSNEEEFFNEVNLSLPTNSRSRQSSPTLSHQMSPAKWNQHSPSQSEEILAKSLLSAEGNQLTITVTAGERSLVSLPDPESSLGESSFANDVATWVSKKETKTDSLLKSVDIKKADMNLNVTKALSSKAYTPDPSTDLFEELTYEGFGSDFDDEFEHLSENSPTKDTLCESLRQNTASSGSLSAEEAVSPLEKCGLPIPDSSDTLIKTGWFPIPSRKSSAVIPAKTSVALLPSESMTKRKVASLMQDRPANQSSRFTREELPAKRVTHTPPAVTNRLTGTKDWLVATAPQPATVEDVFQSIRNLIEKQDWKSLSQLFLISNERNLCMEHLAESLMSNNDISIGISFKKLVMELETSTASDKPSFTKHVIGLLGIHLMERCTAFGNWSDACEVLAEMLKKKIYFHQSFSRERSPADIVKTAVRVCVKVKKYDMIAFLVRQFDFFRGRLTHARDQKKVIKQKYCCLNVVLQAVVKELPVTVGQMETNGKLVLCNIGISILTQILKDLKEDVTKQPEVAELIELTKMFEFLIESCIVHNCSDGLILLSQLQECHPEYLEWKTSKLHKVISFFLELGMMRVLLSDELPLNLIRTATEHQLIPKLPEYVPSKSNILVVWSCLSDLEMRLVILMYLKSILLRVHDLNVSSVPWSIQLVHKEPIIDMKIRHVCTISSLQRLLSRGISPPLRYSMLSPMLLSIDYCTVSVIRKILSNTSVDLKSERSMSCQPSCSTSQLSRSLLLSGSEPVSTGDEDLRQLPWNMQHSNAESRVGFSSLPTTQLKESDETLQLPFHLSRPQNRSGGVRKSFEDKRSNTSLVSSEPVRSAGAKLACENPNSMPATKIPKLDSFVLSVPDIARKDFSSSVTGSSTRKVLLETPKYTDESPKLLQADASVSGMGLKLNPAAGPFIQTPSSPLVRNRLPLSDAIRGRKMQWDGPSSRRQGVSVFRTQNTVASSSDPGPKPQQKDLRQRLTNKKVSRVVEVPSNAGTPVQKLLDLDLLPRPPPYLPSNR